eukprot:11913382-Alexandrium_andersonii.AAC.1
MSASLVGSEMCIRDSAWTPGSGIASWDARRRPRHCQGSQPLKRGLPVDCLLYTSDAADDM